MLKNICFFSNFPLAGSMAKGFYWLSLWNFKRSSISRFLCHSLIKRLRYRKWLMVYSLEFQRDSR